MNTKSKIVRRRNHSRIQKWLVRIQILVPSPPPAVDQLSNCRDEFERRSYWASINSVQYVAALKLSEFNLEIKLKINDLAEKY